MIDRWRLPSVSALSVGVACILVSAFMDWVRAANPYAEIRLVPALDQPVRGAVWITMAVLAGGIVDLVRRRNPALLCCAATMWLLVSMLFWVVGTRLGLLMPVSIEAIDSAFRMGPGALLGSVGGLLVLVGSAVLLVAETIGYAEAAPPGWLAPVGVALALLCVAVRAIPWFTVQSAAASWSLDFDVLPVVGDTLAVFLVAGFVLVVLSVLRHRRWVSVSLVAVACLMALVALTSLAVGSTLDRLASSIASNWELLNDVDVIEVSSAGPLVVLLLGLILAAYGLVRLRIDDRPAPSTVGSRGDLPPAVEVPF